jgi:SAM-dependent methyltransferase
MADHAHHHEHGDGAPRGGWANAEQVAWYQERMDRFEVRKQGERAMVAALPPEPRRVLDLGCGDGRVAAVVLDHRPSVEVVVAADTSPPMLDAARARFADDHRVRVIERDLRDGLPEGGPWDVVVSGMAIHHLEDTDKQVLFGQIADGLASGGTFANLEVVASSTPEEHAAFLAAIERTADDPEDRLALVEDQLAWLEAAGFVDVACPWRWQGFAVLVGRVP